MNNLVKQSGYVALLLPELRIGGAQKVFLTLAKEFIARGLRVDLVLLAEEGELLAEIPGGVRLIPLGQKSSKSPIYLVRSLLELSRFLRKNRPDALLSTLTGTNLFAVVSHCLSHVPTRLVLREAAPLANIRHSYLLFLMRYLYRRADSVVALTHFMKKEMEERLRIPSNKVIQLSNPIDLMRIEQDAAKPLPNDFDATCPYAIAIGRLAPQKDYITLLNAFAEVAKTNSLRLVILGEGPDRSLLEARVRDLSLENRIELRGFDSNPYRWIARASVFVMSSRWEGYPNVLLEALALGKPVVSTCYDASAQDLINNQSGFLVSVGDASALAEGIRNILDDTSTKKISLPAGVMEASLGYLKIMGCL